MSPLCFSLVSVFSCLMVPAHRPCPTASASPPSSAPTRLPPSTTPPGWSCSRSGSGHASPPFSRPLKFSLRSVLSPPSPPFTGFFSCGSLFLLFFYLLAVAPCPIITLKSTLLAPWLSARLWMFVYGRFFLFSGCSAAPLINLCRWLMEDFFKVICWNIGCEKYRSSNTSFSDTVVDTVASVPFPL